MTSWGETDSEVESSEAEEANNNINIDNEISPQNNLESDRDSKNSEKLLLTVFTWQFKHCPNDVPHAPESTCTSSK